MIARFANPHLLIEETEIVSRAAIDAIDSTSNTALDQEESGECLARLERILKRSLGDFDFSESVVPESRRKRRKIQHEAEYPGDSVPLTEPIPFRLVSGSTSLISLKPKPPPELKIVERSYEDDETEAAIRAERAAAVAVDASRIIDESNIPSYPTHNADKIVLDVRVDSLPATPVVLLELPKVLRPSTSGLSPLLKLPKKVRPNPHDFPSDKLHCPVLVTSSDSSTQEKNKRIRRKRHARPEASPHPPSFWRPPQEWGGKSGGYALGYVGSRPVPTGSARQWSYRRDNMRKGMHSWW